MKLAIAALIVMSSLTAHAQSRVNGRGGATNAHAESLSDATSAQSENLAQSAHEETSSVSMRRARMTFHNDEIALVKNARAFFETAFANIKSYSMQGSDGNSYPGRAFVSRDDEALYEFKDFELNLRFLADDPNAYLAHAGGMVIKIPKASEQRSEGSLNPQDGFDRALLSVIAQLPSDGSSSSAIYKLALDSVDKERIWDRQLIVGFGADGIANVLYVADILPSHLYPHLESNLRILKFELKP